MRRRRSSCRCRDQRSEHRLEVFPAVESELELCEVARRAPMKRAVSALAGAAAMSRLRSCCPPCTESPRWPRGGFSVHTKVPSNTRTCTTTSVSSCSASSGVTPAAGAWCSTEHASLPFGTLPYATQTSPQAIGRAMRHRRHPSREASRQALSEQRLVDPGGPVERRALGISDAPAKSGDWVATRQDGLFGCLRQ